MANLRAKDFDFGAPKIMAFKAPGKNVPTKIPGADPQVRFETTAGDTLYLDETPAGDVERGMKELGIHTGQEFRLTRHKTSHGGARFEVERLRGDSGGHNVPQRSLDTSYSQEPPQRPARYSEATALPPLPSNPVTPIGAKLLAAYMLSVDTLLETQVYATRKGLALAITTEDIRCLAATIFIEQNKQGGR